MQVENPALLSCSNDCIKRHFIAVAPDASLLDVVKLMSQTNNHASSLQPEPEIQAKNSIG